ncbi:prepilin-type N-terminal cleavage/methylation domain-containing protein [bacterium]|nr:prepilin-type N-terminal cleavage/methylation domain-containing protein [bacterium]
MLQIRSKSRQLGLTLVELMLVIMLGLVVMLAAGAVYRGVDRSFRLGAHKVVGHQGATLLSTVISRRVRVASGFLIYNVPNRSVASNSGDGLALLDKEGNVTFLFEWDTDNMTLADSTGARVSAASLQNIQFRVDPVSPRTVRFGYQSVDEAGYFVDIESAASLRN